MLFKEIMIAYHDNHKRIINRVCWQNAEICDVTVGRMVCGIIKKVKSSNLC
jgi:hypothetical protein